MLPSGVFGLGRETRLPDLLLMKEDPLPEEEEGLLEEDLLLPVVTCSKAFKGDAACDLSLSNLGAGTSGGEK